MTEILQELEAEPVTYPMVVSTDLVLPITESRNAYIWQRIEAWVAHRWTSRQVEWVVHGSGEFVPPLRPVSVTATECWVGLTWTAAALDPSPLGGFELPGDGPYRITADVGSGTPPEAVIAAAARLHNYMVQADQVAPYPGASSLTIGDMQIQRSPSWLAKAMQNSGAADLLRPYRRVK